MMNRRVLVLIVAALGCACHGGDSSETAAAKPQPHLKAPTVKKGPTVQERTVGMVEAAAQGASTVPVQLKFELMQRPVVGQALDITIAVLPQIDASQAILQVADTDGLNIASSGKRFEIADAEAGEVYPHGVTVTPTTDGVLFLGLSVSLKHDEITESRAFSIPLIVDR